MKNPSHVSAAVDRWDERKRNEILPKNVKISNEDLDKYEKKVKEVKEKGKELGLTGRG